MRKRLLAESPKAFVHIEINFGQIFNFTFRLNFRTFPTRTRDFQIWRTRTRTRTSDLQFWWTQTRTRSLRTRNRTRTRESGYSLNTALYTVSVYNKNRKKAEFAMCFAILIAEIILRFDLIPKFRFANAQIALRFY